MRLFYLDVGIEIDIVSGNIEAFDSSCPFLEISNGLLDSVHFCFYSLSFWRWRGAASEKLSFEGPERVCYLC